LQGINLDYLVLAEHDHELTSAAVQFNCVANIFSYPITR